jgi:hypothetical protein
MMQEVRLRNGFVYSEHDRRLERATGTAPAVQGEPCDTESLYSYPPQSGCIMRTWPVHSMSFVAIYMPFMSLLVICVVCFGLTRGMVLPNEHGWVRRQIEHNVTVPNDTICMHANDAIWVQSVGFIWNVSITKTTGSRIGLRVSTAHCDYGYALLQVSDRIQLRYEDNSANLLTVTVNANEAYCLQRLMAEHGPAGLRGSCIDGHKWPWD